MERLTSSLPDRLKSEIGCATEADLAASCGALIAHFSSSSLFSECVIGMVATTVAATLELNVTEPFVDNCCYEAELVEQLVNPSLTESAKSASDAANWKHEGNMAFGSGAFEKALFCYNKALRFAIWTSERKNRTEFAILFSNRAASLHNLGLMDAALRDCNRAIKLDASYSKAWYRRGRIKRDLGMISEAVLDLESALAVQSSVGGSVQIKSELVHLKEKLIEKPEDLKTVEGDLSSSSVEEMCFGVSSSKGSRFGNMSGFVEKVQKTWSPESGWGSVTNKDLTKGSLILQEETFSAVLLKSCRDTHCHYCFQLLPADPVTCNSCSIPLYCSEQCRGYVMRNSVSTDCSKSCGALQENPVHSVIVQHLAPLPMRKDLQSQDQESEGLGSHFDTAKIVRSIADKWGEHMLECGGASWSAVLPPDAILATRILVKSTLMQYSTKSCMIDPLADSPRHRKVHSMNSSANGGVTESSKQDTHQFQKSNFVDSLCNHYDKLALVDRVELHVLSVILAHCLQLSPFSFWEHGTEIAKILAAKLVLLIAQVRVNAMSIFGMSWDSSKIYPHNEVGETLQRCGQGSNTLCSVEQVRVAQGIFLSASTINHSCSPNAYASFHLRTLSVRAVKNITAGSPIELCYGPQVGELGLLERRKQLQQHYFFTCCCSTCSNDCLSDIFGSAFRCTEPDCLGAVLGPDSPNYTACSAIRELQCHGKQAVCIRCSNNVPKSHCRTVPCSFCEMCGINIGYAQDGRNENKLSGVNADSSILSCGDKDLTKRSLGCDAQKGQCLRCGLFLNISWAHKLANQSIEELQRIESVLGLTLPSEDLVLLHKGALNALRQLKAVLHIFNKQVAKGEDIVARSLCAVNRHQVALSHCQRSIKILEHLYDEESVIVGNEYVKLASIAWAAADMDCLSSSLAKIHRIYRAHYGFDYAKKFSVIAHLQKQANLP